MSGSKKIICSIFSLKGFKSILELKKYITTNTMYRETIDLSKKDIENQIVLSGRDSYYEYKWCNEVEVQCFTCLDKNVNFISVDANIEYGKRVKRDKNGFYLPREERVSSETYRVYFVFIDNECYSIICASKQIFIDRIQKLIGKKYFDRKQTIYDLPSDFFDWFFYKFTIDEKQLGNDYILDRIDGFKGNIVDENNIVKGESYHTSELIVTKAFISNGELLKNITARVRKENEIDIVFALDNESKAVIYIRSSEYFCLFENLEKHIYLVLYLYFVLIPELLKIYDLEKESFINKNKKTFQKKMGLDVIKSIMEYNNISIDEISQI
ncbi:hypothetical protein QUV97_07015 [Enterococcus cecorum]|uniref:hypothetical protein n=1 Tax=Enterococcus cecorum TaxID=44008 RepID=UPI0025A4904C|nr:hypothetical protein [Enterococcus cecorum]MDM8183398.1 hypothetical protein [Enterococcus cecorum]